MKRRAVFIVLLFLTAGTAAAADRALIAAGLSYMLPSDPGYREVYGSRVFYPEAWAGVRVFRGFHLLGGYGWFTKKGTTPELGLEAKSTQQLVWAAVGYIGSAAKTVLFKLEAGPAYISYKEAAMDLTVSGSRIGFRGGLGLLFLGQTVFTGLDLGFVGASDTVDDVKIKLGGFKATLSVGARF